MNVLIESISAWGRNFSANSAIMLIMMIFMLVGAVDKIMGNRHGYGKKFEEGFEAIGPLAMSMAGVMAAAPVLAEVLRPLVTPLYRAVGADPSMFAATLLACDMGGYPLAMNLAADESLGSFAGLILGTMMGPTVVFTIPVALGILSRKDRPYLGAGVLAGMITIPLGCMAGGLAMNLMTEYRLSFSQIAVNLLPVILIALLIVLGLWFAPAKMISGFSAFGTGVTAVITVLTAIAVFEQVTGILFPLLDVMAIPDESGMTPLNTGLLTCGQIGIVLIGAFPMVEWITRTFHRVLEKMGKKLGMNDRASAGMVASLANTIATFRMMGEMDAKGKILNVAFAVSAGFVFGDHLGFTAGVDQSMAAPVILGKLTAGITALLLANWLSPKLMEKISG